MPHQCTDCGRVFDDGSKEMLSGCPGCNGTTFQFHPGDDAVPDRPAADPPEPPERPGEGSVAQKVGSAATTVRDLVGSSPSGPPDPSSGTTDSGTASTRTAPTDAEVSDGDRATTATEDAAQASARTELVSPDELPAAPDRPSVSRSAPPLDEGTDATGEPPAPREDRPDLRELRAELNDQFESIKVLEPGQYELNLMSLYDREEYIVALQEDGKYTIQVPERWKDD